MTPLGPDDDDYGDGIIWKSVFFIIGMIGFIYIISLICANFL